MTEELEIPIETLYEEFYSKLLFLSYSSLKMLIWSPSEFKKKYIDKNYPEKLGKHLVEGKVIHCLLLNNHSFENLFVVSPTTIPTGNNKLVVDRVFANHMQEMRSIEGYTPENDSTTLHQYCLYIVEVLREINLHQSLVDDRTGSNPLTGDQKRIAKMVTEETINYFEYLKTKRGKDVIDQETLVRCQAAAEVVKADPDLRKLMGMESDSVSVYTVINETELRADLRPKWPFGIKGVVDNIVIDHMIRVIRINDFKTTGKSVEEFRDSVEFYKYWLQAVMYISLVVINYKEYIDRGYTIEFRFIVIDSNNQVYPFKVTQTTLNKWFKEFEELLKMAQFHYEERSYNLPYHFAKSLVTL